MENSSSIRKVVFLGDYLPRKCGIATFTTDLRCAVAAAFPTIGLLAGRTNLTIAFLIVSFMMLIAAAAVLDEFDSRSHKLRNAHRGMIGRRTNDGCALSCRIR